MPIELPKAYEPKDAQQKWLAFWDAKGYFHADPAKGGKAYTIVIPPPNVTGALHMGHALNNTLQDVLIRWRRMQGRNTLWMPGTDHAGIATQAVVERLLTSEDKSFKRREYGREKLVAKIWEWKEKYEARILGQLKQMGASCDWSRTRFTLDETCAKAVRETFFRMFRDGYIYRGKRLVNWDTQLQTSVADDETYTETTKGGFWTFKYAVLDEPGASATGHQKTVADASGSLFIQFSTTRPETMLGDTALCVHPDDERYKALVGKKVLQPHTGREIPIIADGQLAKPELGTGCVKVTPAHDPNDYSCWQRNPQIGIINIMNPDGTIAAGFGEYSGLDRAKAREAVVAKMEELGLFVDKQDRDIPLPYSDRSKTPIEPFLSDQWFVKMADMPERAGSVSDGPRTGPRTGPRAGPRAGPRTGSVSDGGDGATVAHASGSSGLAQLAMEAVTSGRVKFFPERYAKTYLDWLGEKRDWCISRQLWWGHRIPVWSRSFESRDSLDAVLRHEGYASNQSAHQIQPETNTLHVCLLKQDAELIADMERQGFTQSEDVLDTWFSSALWPHSTLGWPEQSPEMAKYYPTSTLCTSRDIITLWVARMVLTGLYNVGEIPFHHVYIHPKIMDGFGEGMSKSKGNGADPLDIIDIYGTDAMRYGMAALATETQDSRMPISNVCPHCGTLIPQKKEHQSGRTKKLVCPGNKPAGIVCGKAFRPSGPWLDEDAELPTAKAASDRFEVGRTFANKLWNATRFILMNLEGYTPAAIDPKAFTTEDRWIVSRLATTAKAVTAALEAYKFADVAKLVYDFAWSEFCDWYIEMSKSRRSDPACQRVLVGVLDGILRLVHPVMPFLAESLWEALGEVAPERGFPTPKKAEEAVCIAAWPNYPDTLIDASTEIGIARMQEVIRGVRELRNRYQVDKAPLTLAVKCSDAVAKDLQALAPFITALGGLTGFECGPNVAKPKQSGSFVTAEFEAYVPLAGLIDPVAETKRLEKQIADITKQVGGMTAKLGNASYVANAPPEVVAETREKVAELEQQVGVLKVNLADLQ
jgi:valyl-tRNA synthetase